MTQSELPPQHGGFDPHQQPGQYPDGYFGHDFGPRGSGEPPLAQHNYGPPPPHYNAAPDYGGGGQHDVADYAGPIHDSPREDSDAIQPIPRSTEAESGDQNQPTVPNKRFVTPQPSAEEVPEGLDALVQPIPRPGEEEMPINVRPRLTHGHDRTRPRWEGPFFRE